LLENKDDIQ